MLKKIVVMTSVCALLVSGFITSVSAYVDTCTVSVPIPDAGYSWVTNAMASLDVITTDQDGSCTWTGPLVCNATTMGTGGEYLRYTTGPGSRFSVTQFACVGEGLPSTLDVRIAASPNLINLGSNTTLTWSTSSTLESEHTVGCTASGAWSGEKSASGSEVVSPTADSTYTLVCREILPPSPQLGESEPRKGGAPVAPGSMSAPQSVTVSVNPFATINVTSNLSSADWFFNIQKTAAGTGSGSVIVSPGAGGTGYTITPEVVSGYTVSVSPVNPVFVVPGDVASLSITYTPIAPEFDYTLSATPVTVVQGGGSQATLVTETLISGTPQNIYLSLSGLPAGVSATYAPQPCQPNCTTNVGITAEGSVIPGTYLVTVLGSTADGLFQRTTNFNLTISPASSFTVSCSASPSFVLVGQPVTWTANVVGNSGPLTYAWSGDEMPTLPAPSTNPYTISYEGSGRKTATILVTDAGSGASGASTISCTPVTIQLRVKPNFQEI